MITVDDDTRKNLRDTFSTASESSVVLGFDGFVDVVHEMVATRHDVSDYDRIESLGSLGERILLSADQNSSQTIEWVPQSTGPGGYTTHCGKALQALGAQVKFVGTFGQPIADPFADEFDPDLLQSVGEPTETHAVEFGDAKLILINSRTQLVLGWSHLNDQLGKNHFAQMVDGCDALGIGTWGKIPNSPSIWDGLRTEVFPHLDDPPAHVLLDVGNVRLLDREALVDGAVRLRRLNETVPVTISGNRGEINYLAEQLSGQSSKSFRQSAVDARESLGVRRIIGHNASRVVLSTADETTDIQTPVIDDPTKLLSAGDKFNAGIILGLQYGLRSRVLLLAGDLVARFFVENGRCPRSDEICSALDANFR